MTDGTGAGLSPSTALPGFESMGGARPDPTVAQGPETFFLYLCLRLWSCPRGFSDAVPKDGVANAVPASQDGEGSGFWRSTGWRASMIFCMAQRRLLTCHKLKFSNEFICGRRELLKGRSDYQQPDIPAALAVSLSRLRCTASLRPKSCCQITSVDICKVKS